MNGTPPVMMTMVETPWPPPPSSPVSSVALVGSPPLAPPADGCPTVESATYVVPYESARLFVYALTLSGLGIVIGLTAIAAMMLVLIRRLSHAVTVLQKETRVELCTGLLNGDAASDHSPEHEATGTRAAAAAKPKKKRGNPVDHNSGTSCAEEYGGEESL